MWFGLLNLGVIVLTPLGILYLIHVMVKNGDQLIDALFADDENTDF